MSEGLSTLEQKLRLSAEIVVQQMTSHTGFQRGFNEESVEWIDSIFDRHCGRKGFDAKDRSMAAGA